MMDANELRALLESVEELQNYFVEMSQRDIREAVAVRNKLLEKADALDAMLGQVVTACEESRVAMKAMRASIAKLNAHDA